MPSPRRLSRRQQQIMEVVYARGSASVNEVVQALDDAPTPTAIRTLMNILVDRRMLKRKRAGRENLYLPTRPRKAEGISALRRVLETFFDGSVEKAVAAHLSDPKAELSGEELKRLEQLLRNQKD